MTSTPRPKRVRKNPEARRAEIVAKAAEIALAEGLEIITLNRVATELGVRPGLIGHYFPVAQDLVDEAFGTAATAELDTLLPEAGPAPAERIARFVAATSGEAYDGMSRLWLNARHLARYRPTLRERVERQERRWTTRLTAAIADGVAAGEFTCPDPAYAAIAILVVMDGLGASANTGTRADDPPAVDLMVTATAERELGLKPGTLSALTNRLGPASGTPQPAPPERPNHRTTASPNHRITARPKERSVPHPDLVLFNARLLDPGVGGLLPHTALAAAGGVVTALGDDRTVRALAGPATTVVDLRGAVVTPGFVDGHIHPVYGVERTLGVDFSDCADLDAVRARIAASVAGLERGAWLKGWGLDPNAFGDRPVSAAALGPALDGVPALIDLFDAHSALASPAALALAGVTGPRQFQQASEIVCDADGVPTGLLLEDAACSVVEAVAPRPTDEQLRAQTVKVLREMAAAGLTGGHAMDGEPATLAAVAALEAEDLLPLRFRFAPWCQPGADVAPLIRRQGQGGRLWRVDGVKLFMDGTIDNGTAWLERPDCHGESTHAFWPDPAAYTEAVAELHRAGVPTATHAIGDAAVRHALDAIELAQKRMPDPKDGPESGRRPRHRIEHIETVPDDTVDRFAGLGVVASMQPTHCCDYTRADHTDNWSQRLGEPRASRAWRTADLWNAGATVVLGSDWPIAPYPPLTVMSGARHRRPTRDPARPPHGPEQALTPLRALRGYTLNPAYAAGEEHVAGRLAEGFRADLTVLAENPLAVPDLELAHVPVLLTVVAGAVTHRASEL